MKYLRLIWNVAKRECKILYKNPIYGFCMVIFPLVALLFFTSLMDEGLPEDMPVGIVDLDNTTTTRALVRRLDAFQNSRVVDSYTSVAEARRAIQENRIYAFLYIPRGTTAQLLASRRPKVSYYYSLTSLTGGSLLMKNLKTIATLGSAGVGQGILSAHGLTDKQIETFLQPIRLDVPDSQPLVQLQHLPLGRLRAGHHDALHVPHSSLLAGHGAKVQPRQGVD